MGLLLVNSFSVTVVHMSCPCEGMSCATRGITRQGVGVVGAAKGTADIHLVASRPLAFAAPLRSVRINVFGTRLSRAEPATRPRTRTAPFAALPYFSTNLNTGAGFFSMSSVRLGQSTHARITGPINAGRR